MTIKWQYNHSKKYATGRNQTKLPDFCRKNERKIPCNKFVKRSLNNFQKLAKPSKMGICELVFYLVVLFPFFCSTNNLLLIATTRSSIVFRCVWNWWISEVSRKKRCSILRAGRRRYTEKDLTGDAVLSQRAILGILDMAYERANW